MEQNDSNMLEQIDAHLLEGNLNEAAELIRIAIDSGIYFQDRHILYAHTLLLCKDWLEISSLLPQDTNILATSGWLDSVYSNRPVNAELQPIPWFTYPAIDYLDTVIQNDWMVFEWGSGNSTLWWSAKAQSIISVEDNQDWVNELKPNLPGNASVLYQPTQEEYVHAIDRFEDGYFDVVVIDGSHRNECAKQALSKVSQSGMIVFDNSDGKDFVEGVNYLSDRELYRLDFWGLIPSYLYKNCTSVFLKDPKLLQKLPCPATHRSSVGVSCFQAMDSRKNS